MFHTISLFISSLFIILGSSPALADEGILLAQYDRCWGYGMQLLYNDVNSDLLVLNVVPAHDPDTGNVIKTRLQVVHLQRRDSGNYTPGNERTVFDTTRMINYLDWTYDPESKRYIVAFLHGEQYDDSTNLKLLLLDLDGSQVGNEKTLPQENFELLSPYICYVPDKTVGAPPKARFFFIARGWISAVKRRGIISVFLDANGNAIGQVAFSIEELLVDNKIPMHEPQGLIPSGDNKGFLIICKRREYTQDILKPTVIRLKGNAKYENHINLSSEEPLYKSMSIQQVSKKKFAVAWADENTYRFWVSIVRNNVRKAKTAKLVSEQPSCSGDFEDPSTAFCHPEGMKRANLFFIGSSSDTSIYRTQIKKNGKTKNHEQLSLWSGNEWDPYMGFNRWFAVAPVKGTDAIYCVLVTHVHRSDTIEIYGYPIDTN